MSYILPAIPPIGLLLGRWGVGEPPAERGGWDRRLWNIGAAAFPALALVIFALWGIAYFRLIPERVYAISSISVVALIPVLAVMIYASIRKFKFDFSGLLFLNAGILLSCALLLSPLAGKDFNVLLHINSSHVYKRLAKELKPDDTLVVFWSYRPALPFYTGRMYVPFQERNELEFGMNMEPERRAWLDNKEDLFALLRNACGRVFAIVEPRDISEKFAALQLNVKETLLPSDPDTVVYELIKPNGHEKRNNIN